jgi:uncharacterized repeat protein (TIGR03803 family)
MLVGGPAVRNANMKTSYRVTGLILLAWMAMAVAASAQTLITLANFGGSNGQYPGSLIQGPDGNIWGTTGFETCGTIFNLTATGKLTTVYKFTCDLKAYPDGPEPGGLILGTDGNIYGLTNAGGANNDGSVFKLTPTGTFSTLLSFDGPNGREPIGMIQASDGNFYGITYAGGKYAPFSGGTAFKLTPTGELTTLYTFGGPEYQAPQQPYSTFTEGKDGNFYGVTYSGGTQESGVFYKLTPEGDLAVLYSFQGGPDQISSPTWPLTLGTDGNFYSVDDQTGPTLNGSIFRITPEGVLTDLHDFSGTDGRNPSSVLIPAPGGNFYGTTSYGGAHYTGTIFEVTPTGDVTTLYSLPAGNQVNPADLVRGPDSQLYGTTLGGTSNLGTVFMLKIADFVVTANPATVTVSAPGGSGATTLTIIPSGGFDTPLSYACSGLPAGATCAFAAGARNTENVTIQTTAPSAQLDNLRFNQKPLYAVLLFSVGMVLFPAPSRRKRVNQAWLGVLVSLLLSLILAAGCGGGSGNSNNSGNTPPANPGTPAGTSTVTVTAATADGFLSHSLAITLSVK